MQIHCGVFLNFFGKEQKRMKKNYYWKHLRKWQLSKQVGAKV
jgi:hypothetical protein